MAPPRSPRFSPRVGLGIWRLAGPGRPRRADALATIEAAYEAGVRVFDTADCYCLDDREHGYGELLLRDALAGAGDVTFITKGGFGRPGGDWEHRGDPRRLERAIEDSADRLGVTTIDCYLLHGIDPAVDMVDSLSALVAGYESGRLYAIGISRVSPDQLARACAAAPISVVQNRLSVTVRTEGWRTSCGCATSAASSSCRIRRSARRPRSPPATCGSSTTRWSGGSPRRTAYRRPSSRWPGCLAAPSGRS